MVRNYFFVYQKGMKFVKINEMIEMGTPEATHMVLFVDNDTKRKNDFDKMNTRILLIKYVNKSRRVIHTATLNDDEYVFGFNNLTDGKYSKIVIEVAESEYKKKLYHKQEVFECSAHEIEELANIQPVAKTFIIVDEEEPVAEPVA